MNVYRFELRRQWKSVFSWTLVLSLLLAALMVAVYPVYLGSRADLQKVLEGFPPEFAAAFGVSLDSIFSYGGFYAFCYLYIALCGAIMAASLGLSVFAREKRSKCTDFLLTKPLSRARLFGAKLAVCVALLFLSSLFYSAVFLLICRTAPESAAPLGNVLLAAGALFFIELLFLSIAIAAATFFKKVRSVSGIAVAIGFGGFILTALHSLLEEDWTRYIAPFKYFDVTLAFSQGRYEAPYVLTAAALGLGLLALSFLRYVKSDVHAV